MPLQERYIDHDRLGSGAESLVNVPPLHWPAKRCKQARPVDDHLLFSVREESGVCNSCRPLQDSSRARKRVVLGALFFVATEYGAFPARNSATARSREACSHVHFLPINRKWTRGTQSTLSIRPILPFWVCFWGSGLHTAMMGRALE